MTELRCAQLYHCGELMGAHVVTINNGVIEAIEPCAHGEGLLIPMFTDLQVNGGGVLLNNEPNVDGLAKIASAHHDLGTAEILATVISDTPEIMESAANAVIASCDDPRILGIHIEGPHLNAKKRGTHAAKYIRPMDADTFAILSHLRDHHVPTMITLAPELLDAEDFKKLQKMGVVVSAGHSMATFDETQKAIELGLNCFTHLYNAMPAMETRSGGIVAAAILSNAYLGIIADGIHVGDEMIRLAMAARPCAGRMFLVSDAMATVGGATEFSLYGETIELQSGRLINASGDLAGAHCDMFSAFRYVLEQLDVTLEMALDMAICAPRRVMGLDAPSLIGRETQNCLCLSPKFERIDFP